MLEISERTFGLEVEFGDVHRENMDLPDGYGWSKDEKSIVNTNAKKSTPSGSLGGELNTRPLSPTRNDIREVRRVTKDAFNASGVIMWNTGFDGHLYIGDLELPELQKLFMLGFYTSAIISEVFNIADWFNVEHLCPSPTYELAKTVMEAKTIEQMKNRFSNSSNRGHYRFLINIMPYFKTKTLEFRIFNGTHNFRETLETIKFMYKFVDYALTHEEEDYKKIETAEDFCKTFDLKREKLPKSTPPLLFAESHMEATRNIAKGFAPSSKILSAVHNDTGEEIALVNPFNFVAELAMYKSKRVSIYNNSEFNHILYEMATGKLEITYTEHFNILNSHKDGTPEEELMMFMIFNRTQKYSLATDYGAREFMAYVNKIEQSKEKLKEWAVSMVELFKDAKYQQGTLDHALAQEKEILYQQEFNSKANSTVASLSKYSDYISEFTALEISYQNIESKIGDSKLLVASRNDFLPMHKIAKDSEVTLYSNIEGNLGVRKTLKEVETMPVEIPSSDFVIEDPKKIRVTEMMPRHFSIIQKRFVKKVTKFSQPKICYVITYDKLVLGAFGFDYPKNEEYDLFLLSDFCTNNDVKLLSKLVLFIIKSKEVKKLLQRKMVQKIRTAYTKVYTSMPVSMKYRGAFKKVPSESPNSLVYEFEFGTMGTIMDAVKEYNKRKKNTK